MLYLENHFRTLYTVAWRLDKDVPKPHFISLGVLQIVKTLGKIVQLSNFILLVHFLHITGWLFFLTEIFSMLFVWNAFIRRELVINYDTKGKILQTYTISMSIALYQLINDF